jgi:hypothetical protein
MIERTIKYVDCGKNKRNADLAKIKECAANGWIAVLGRYNYSDNGNGIQDLIAELEGTMPSEGYKEGDILNTDWGWEQTNVEFYQVVKATEKSVWLREIDNKATYSSKTMSGDKTPIPGKFVNATILKRKMPYKGESIKIQSFIPAFRWKGLPVHYSSYA